MREGEDDILSETDNKVIAFWNKMMKQYGDADTYEETIKNKFCDGDIDILIDAVFFSALNTGTVYQNLWFNICRICLRVSDISNKMSVRGSSPPPCGRRGTPPRWD